MTPPGYIPIGQFARATGLTAKALRRYAAAGVLVPATVNESTGYRFYRPDQVATGQVVRTLRELGVPVAEVPPVLAALAGGVDVSTLLADRVRADEALVAHRHRLLGHLSDRLKGIAMSHPVTVRTMDAAPALIRRATIIREQLDEFTRKAYVIMYAAAGHGPLALNEPAYLRYHGRVDDEDTRVQVDACLPYSPERAQPRNLPDEIDILPARTFEFASTTLGGAATLYPRVLDGYDAVAEWITRHGFAFAGPAYEIFQLWTGEIGHERNVLEVGFPIQDAA